MAASDLVQSDENRAERFFRELNPGIQGTTMAGETTIKRLRDHADAASEMQAVVLGEAADKIERLIAALGSAKIGLMNKHDSKLVKSAQEDINEALRSLDKDL